VLLQLDVVRPGYNARGTTEPRVLLKCFIITY